MGLLLTSSSLETRDLLPDLEGKASRLARCQVAWLNWGRNYCPDLI
jgi:hypothetical protein